MYLSSTDEMFSKNIFAPNLVESAGRVPVDMEGHFISRTMWTQFTSLQFKVTSAYVSAYFRLSLSSWLVLGQFEFIPTKIQLAYSSYILIWDLKISDSHFFNMV
jgi:hypothetical protein